MNSMEKETLEHYRRVEEIIRHYEDEQAKLEEMKAKIIPTREFGPASYIVRYFYLLEQQNSTHEECRQLQEEYLRKFQIDEEPIQPDDENQANSPKSSQSSEPQDIPPTESAGPLPTPPVGPLSAQPVVPPPTQSVVPPPIQPAAPPPIQPVVPPPTQPVVPPPPQPAAPPPTQPVVRPPPQPAAPSPPPQKNESVVEETAAMHKNIIRQAEIYENQYRTVEKTRQDLLTSVVKSILNKLRKETYQGLKDELIGFLQGQEQVSVGKPVKILSEEERIYTLARLAVSILAQLLGGDLNDVKTEIFLPLVRDVSSNERSKEFATIFLHQLYKKCPYTIPSYPERTENMTEEQYKEILGFRKKKENDQIRFENESEFLNRMNGLIRLFCKLLTGGGPPFDAKLSFAWRWIATILNLEPHQQITAILVRVFIEEAADKMYKSYGVQFIKIMDYLEKSYLKRLQAHTSSDQMTRLTMTLQEWKANRNKT